MQCTLAFQGDLVKYTGNTNMAEISIKITICRSHNFLVLFNFNVPYINTHSTHLVGSVA